jgi:hypothetical protein
MGFGERDVTLTIKVKDGEVTASEAKLKRLKAAANDVGSGSNANVSQQSKLDQFLSNYEAKIQKIRNSAKPAEDAIKGVSEAAEGSGEAAAAAGVSIGALAGAATIAVVGLLALIAITEQVAQHIDEDVKAFARYGVQVGQMSDDTGLAAETVSSLNAELESQGRAFNDIKGPIDNFRKLIGQAAAGSDEARGKLKLLGIDGSKAIYDIDGAFKSVIATLVRTTNPIDQSRLGFAVFGSEWVKLHDIIRDFPGDVDAVIRKYEELGIVMSGDDVKASKEFTRTIADLQNTFKGIQTTLGREFLPTVRDVAKELGAFITKHKEGILSFAETFGNAAVRVIHGFESIVKWIDDHPTLVGLLGKFFDYATSGNISGLSTASTLAIPRQPQGPKLYDYSRPQDTNKPPDLAAMQAKIDEQQKLLKESIERNKRDWDAAIKEWQDSGTQAGEALGRIFDDLKNKLESGGSVEDFVKGVNDASGKYLNLTKQIYDQLDALEDERARRNKATEHEITLLHAEQLRRRQDAEQKGLDFQKKGIAAYVKYVQDEFNRTKEAMDAELDTADKLRSLFNNIGAIKPLDAIEQQHRPTSMC